MDISTIIAIGGVIKQIIDTAVTIGPAVVQYVPEIFSLLKVFFGLLVSGPMTQEQRDQAHSLWLAANSLLKQMLAARIEEYFDTEEGRAYAAQLTEVERRVALGLDGAVAEAAAHTSG